jgi:hypothetical protein
MSIESFRQLLAGLVPKYLRRRNGGSYLESVGMVLDDASQTLVEGLRASMPLLCEEDTLAKIGKDRKLRRMSNETVESFRARLARWRQTWRHSASHYGELMAIQPYFLPGALPILRIVHQSGDGAKCTWHTLLPDGTYSVHRATPSNWSWDASYGAWSRFWLIIYVDGMGPATAVYGDGTTYGDGSTTYGLHLSLQQVLDIVGIVDDIKGPHSTLAGVILATDPASFDPESVAVVEADGSTTLPDGNWGGIIDPSTGLPSRLSTAVFPYEIGAL